VGGGSESSELKIHGGGGGEGGRNVSGGKEEGRSRCKKIARHPNILTNEGENDDLRGGVNRG